MNDDNYLRTSSETGTDKRRGNDRANACEVDFDNLIDRLVSGDLDEDRRKRLLAWLDAQPVRWRQCGLAFLEVQLWQQAFHELVDDTSKGNETWHSRSLAVQHAVRPKSVIRLPVVLTTLAASMLFTFGLGTMAGSAWQKQADRLVKSPVTERSSSLARSDRIQQEHVSDADMQIGRARSSDAVSSTVGQDRLAASVTPTFAVVKLRGSESGSREVHVPLLEGQAIDERWLQAEPAELPEYVQDELGRRGYQLRQRRRFMDVQLEDGRRAIVPVDQYTVSFVGHRSL